MYHNQSYKYLQLNTNVISKRHRYKQVAILNYVAGLYIVLSLLRKPSHRARKSPVKDAGPSKSLSSKSLIHRSRFISHSKVAAKFMPWILTYHLLFLKICTNRFIKIYSNIEWHQLLNYFTINSQTILKESLYSMHR